MTARNNRFLLINHSSATQQVAVVFVLATTLLLGLLPNLAEAVVIRPFSTRYATTTNGKIFIVGNTSLRADPANPNAAAAQAGTLTGGAANNNSYAMLNVDVDADATTFNSSRASFALPPGAEVLWAGLYWGADTEGSTAGNPPNIAQRDRVQFSTGGGYQTIISQIPVDQNSGGFRYQGFAEVTNLVRQQGAGTTRTYATANVQAVTGTGPSHYGGWSLVVAIRDPAVALRHLHVYDGFVQIDNVTPTDTTTVTGFRTPLAGAFNTDVGMVAYEGDLGSTGDYFQVNGFIISDPLNPLNNFFNSSITRAGVRITDKNPDYVNQLGFDIDVVDVPYALGIIPNGSTSANLTFGMVGDWYYPGVLTFAIDVFDPILTGNIIKTMVDLNGGALYGDDEIEFTISLGNTGNDNATDVILTDPIPPNTTYVPGSLRISSGPNAGPKTDAAGDDQANFDAGNNRVVFRVGTGANAVNGGTINIGQFTEVKFRVKVNTGVPPGTTLQNEATVNFIGQNSGLPYSAKSNLLQVIAEEFVNLSLTKTSDAPTYFEGNNAVFTLTLSNAGPDEADNVVVTDVLPAGLLFQSAVASRGAYNVGSGLWTVGTLANGASATLTLTVRIDAGAAALTQPLVNTATATADQIDTAPANNTASVNFIAQVPSNLSTSIKTVTDLDGGDAKPGDILRYAITITETAGTAVSGVTVTDQLAASFNFASFGNLSIPAGASSNFNSGTGLLTVTNVSVPANGSVSIVFDITINVAAPMGTIINNMATITNPLGAGAAPAAPPVTVANSVLPGTGVKPLYFYNDSSTPAFKLSRTPMPTAPGVNVAIPRGNTTQTWTLSPSLQSNVTINSGTIPVQLWMATDSNRNYNIPVTLQCGAVTVASQTLTYSLDATTRLFNFNLPLASNYTCPAGSTFSMSITNTQGAGGGARNILVFPSPAAGNTSNVAFSSQNVINVDSVTAYTDIAYPGGAVLPNIESGRTLRIRATVSDPFGSYDISAATVTITDPLGSVTVGPVAMTQVFDSGTAAKVYEYRYTISPGAPVGIWTFRVRASEGIEGTITDDGVGTLLVLQPLPLLTCLKSSRVYSDPVNGTTNPKAIPGADIIYALKITNFGTGVAESLVFTDPVPPESKLFVGDLGQGKPVLFIDGAVASGFVPADVAVSYSSTIDCTNYTYDPLPTADADSYNTDVCNLRVTMNNTKTLPGGNAEFNLEFRVRIE